MGFKCLLTCRLNRVQGVVRIHATGLTCQVETSLKHQPDRKDEGTRDEGTSHRPWKSALEKRPLGSVGSAPLRNTITGGSRMKSTLMTETEKREGKRIDDYFDTRFSRRIT